MKNLQTRLDTITSHIRQEKENAIQLLKDYIRQHGAIDWSGQADGTQIETTFYGDGYFTAPVIRVDILKDRGLTITSDEYEYDEHSDAFTNDTLLDILCCVIGNNLTSYK